MLSLISDNIVPVTKYIESTEENVTTRIIRGEGKSLSGFFLGSKTCKKHLLIALLRHTRV